MKILHPWLSRLALIASVLVPALPAHADYTQRFSLGVGFVHLDNPSTTNFDIGAEYEYRLDSVWGLGGQGNYIFSNPGITLLALPDLYFHPFGGEFFVSAAPLVEFGSGIGTHWGTRLGTRLPISLGAVAIIPSFAVDFIDGGHNYLFGFGISI